MAGIACALVTYGQLFAPVSDSSVIRFTIKNLGINVSGTIGGLTGSIHFDPAQTENSAFHVQVEPATINTGNNKRDHHLQQAVFFDVQNYPAISFVSTKVTRGKKAGTFFMEGTLTIKSVSLPLSFPFTAVPTSDGYWMEGSFDMRRKPYGIGGTSTISDKLNVNLRVLARKTDQTEW